MLPLCLSYILKSLSGTLCPSWVGAGGNRWQRNELHWPVKEAGVGWLSYKRLKSTCMIDYEF